MSSICLQHTHTVSAKDAVRNVCSQMNQMKSVTIKAHEVSSLCVEHFTKGYLTLQKGKTCR